VPPAAQSGSGWEKEAVLERAEARMATPPAMMKLRRSVVEHPFGTIKFWNYQWALQTRGFAGARRNYLVLPSWRLQIAPEKRSGWNRRMSLLHASARTRFL